MFRKVNWTAAATLHAEKRERFRLAQAKDQNSRKDLRQRDPTEKGMPMVSNNIERMDGTSLISKSSREMPIDLSEPTRVRQRVVRLCLAETVWFVGIALDRHSREFPLLSHFIVTTSQKVSSVR
jgi:hypothetical protein